MISEVYTDHVEENSLEHVLVSEVYPKKQMVQDQAYLEVPFTPLCGESVEYLGKTSEGVIALSNYRLFIEAYVNIPIGLIETVEYRDIFHLHIFSKDARTVRCKFLTNDICLEWYKRLLQAIQPKHKLQDIFAFAFSAWYMEAFHRKELPEGFTLFASLSKSGEGHFYSFGKEVNRMSFDTHKAWRITYINEKFNVCSSYPKLHLVPSSVTDKDIESIANFRSSRRFPSIVWRDTRNGAVIVRSSQPEVGWLGWRNTQDENFLQSVALSCCMDPGVAVTQRMINGDVLQKEANSTSQSNGVASAGPKNVLIIDARSYAAAVANRAKGGGCECTDYYQNCEIMFMSLANIHAIRKSFLALRTLCAMSPEQPGWLTSIENTKWLHHISGLLKASLVVVNAIDKEHRCVLVHCSDGWDRTPQITALAELMLDPYYRTVEGFRVLVEKEWLEFGHKFADRCGQGLPTDDVNERCPVFLQWLDCVHQLICQFPCAFQINEAFLVKLVQHAYSCLFGDFLCNTEKERQSERIYQQTISVWKLLCCPGNRFVNLLYRPASERDRILRPSCQIQNLRLWNSVYLSEMLSFATSTEDLIEVAESDSSSSVEAGSDLQLPAKTRSCEDLGKEVNEELHPTQIPRRLSDPNLTREFPFDASEPSKVLALLSQETAADEDVLAQANITKTNGAVCEVNKCASNETLKAHEDDEHITEVILKQSELKGLCPNDPSSEHKSYCDTLNNNYGQREERLTSAVDRLENQVPSSFEDSSETLTGAPTEINQHLSAPSTTETFSSYYVNGKKSVRDISVFGDNPLMAGYLSNCVTATESSSMSAAKVMLEKCSSTSDLNSWHVDGRRQSDLKCHQLKLGLGPITVDTSGASALPPSPPPFPYALIQDGYAKDLEFAGPQLPGGYSSNPPTPNGDSKSVLWGVKQSGRWNRCLDYDGLSIYWDPVQQRISQIKLDYEQQLRQMERQLAQAKFHIRQLVEQTNGAQFVIDINKDEAASTDSSGEHASVGGRSAVASDLSWEQVEEKDAQMTLWVPDHVVTHCTGCDQEFWVARRKHHCRSCGQVFCDECSKFSIPVPQQQLNNPVRVCRRCYLSVTSVNDLTYSATMEKLRLSAPTENGFLQK